MNTTLKLHGLVAATHTPFHANGDINPNAVDLQAQLYAKQGIRYAFITGSTGESSSLQLSERMEIMAAWKEAAQKHNVEVIVHVGSNSIRDAAALAAETQRLGFKATSALAPSYFKPGSVQALVNCCAEIAAAAPALPFYYYDIPVLTGVRFSMVQFIELAKAQIPNFAGIKFTNPDLAHYIETLHAAGNDLDIPWGVDEWFAGALATGARGAVGSSFNFAPKLYQDIIAAYENGDHETLKALQLKSAQMITIIASAGYMGTAKAIMGWHGVPVGPARLPQGNPSADQLTLVRKQLDELGYFDWAMN